MRGHGLREFDPSAGERYFFRVRSSTLPIVLAVGAAGLLGCADPRNGSELRARLEGGSAAERLEALKILGRVPTGLDVAALRRALDDPSPAVRIEALALAARHPEPQIVDWIGPRVLDPDPQVRRAALEALASFPPAVREPHLLAAYPLQDLAGRTSILRALGDGDDRLHRLIRAEAEALWQRHLRAVREGGIAELEGALELIGRSGRPEAVSMLARLLESESVRVAVAAARGLGHAGGLEARWALETLAAAEDPERRAAGLVGLAELGLSPPEGESLRASLFGAGPEEASDPLFARIAELERQGDAEALLRLFRRTGAAEAAVALARLGRAEAVEPLFDLDDPGRATAAWIRALVGVRDASAPAAARLYLAHDRPAIRAAAAEVLGRRCDWEAMPLLRALAAEDYFVEVRRAAKQAVRAIRACPRTSG